MSQVINWLTKTRGPEAVIIYGDWYDYELSTQLYELPEKKADVFTALQNIFQEIDPQFQENIVINLKIGAKPIDEYNYDDFVKHGAGGIHEKVTLRLEQNWGSIWNLDGYITDTDGTWEFSFRRHNFV
jgi:hypothetical protein